MKRKSYLWHCAVWLLAGIVLNTYLSRTSVPHRLHVQLKLLLNHYPASTQVPLIAFLFLLAFGPAVNLFRRYRHNWQAKSLVFTAIESTLLFAIGAIVPAIVKGSTPHAFCAYSNETRTALFVWTTGFGTFLTATIVRSLFEPAPMAQKPNRDSLMDIAITDDSEDILGRVKFADDYYSQIKQFPSEDSLVFGLNGPWGSGKTSVLNLLRNRLRRNRDIIVVDFNPWYFQSPETVTRQFYNTIAHAMNREFFYSKLSSTARRYARILAPVLKRYGIEFVQADGSTVEEVKDLVESYIADSGRRVVVIIDDLERAHRDELLTVLQIVRLSANFRNTLFILAYDQTQISLQLKNLGISSDFLDKIVQSPQDIPAADQNEIDRFLIYSDSTGYRSQLDKLLDKLKIPNDRREEFDKKSAELYVSTLGPFFPTLRHAKRFLIGFSVRLPVVKDEVYLPDFFLLEVLRVFANRIYQDILNNPYYYIPEWTNKGIMASPFGLEYDDKRKDERREKIREHLDRLVGTESRKDNILAILKTLFPVRIADAFERPASYGDSAAAVLRADKRLTHPACFEKYFLLAIPKGTLSDAAVEATLASWAEAAEPETAIAESFEPLRARHQLVDTLDRMVIFLKKIDEKLITPILKTLTLKIKEVPLDGDRSEQDAEFKFMLFLLDERVPDSQKQNSVETVLRNTPAISVAVRIVLALVESQSGAIWNLRRSVDPPRIKAIVAERFRREFVESGIDIFQAIGLPLYVLYQIGIYDPQSAKMVNAYAMALLEREPRYIGKLIDGFLIEFPGGGPNGFNFDSLKSVYDVKHLAELVERAGESAWSKEKEKRAIDSFLDLVRKASPNPE
jgi:predicted KAP-like P-loop ATPase